MRDASILADRVIERLQNKRVRTAILVFDACRNNPFERSGTRAVAGGGGLAPMTQLPEGVFSVFSAGPRQTALDRLSNNDNNPNSVFTRTFAKELTAARRKPRAGRAAHAPARQRDGRDRQPQADPGLFRPDGRRRVPQRRCAKAPEPRGRKARRAAAAEGRGAAAGGGAAWRRQKESVNAPIAMFSRHNGGWTVVFSIADPTLGISWRMGDTGDFRETGFMDTLDPRTRKRMPNPSIELAGRRAGGHDPGALCRYQWRNAGAVPDPVRSGGSADPRPAQDPRHDRDELAVVPRIQRAAGLLHAPDVVSLRDPRGARSASTARCRTRF